MPLSEVAPLPAPIAEAPAAPPAPAPIGRPWQVWAAWGVVLVGAAPRVWAAIWDQSIFWPDEIFQTLEQAHRMAFHTGFIPWEFRGGARSWVFPGAIGLLWKAMAALGVKSSFGLVVGAKLSMAALGVSAIEIGRRLAARLAGPNAGLVAALFLAACPLEIFFGARAMTEMASGPPILLAAYLALYAERPRPALGGALAALAIFLRYQNGLVAVGLLVVLALRRDRRAVIRYAAAATVVGLAGGMLDWATWSYPFQSFWVYFKFNAIDGKASGFGTAPITYFAEHLQSSIGASFGVILLGLVAAWRRARGVLVVVLVYFLAHSAVPHKELRFMLPILPLALALAAAGLTQLCEAWSPGPRLVLNISLVCAVAMGLKAVHPTKRDLGAGDSSWPLWHSGEDYFRTMWEAEKHPNLCGVSLVGNQRWWTGGYTYLNRDVPIYLDRDHLKSTNYLVGGKSEHLPNGWKKIFEYKQYGLYRRDGPCAPNPHYKSWL